MREGLASGIFMSLSLYKREHTNAYLCALILRTIEKRVPLSTKGKRLLN